MFRYYLGVAVIMIILTGFSLLLSDRASALAEIFIPIAAGFVAVAFITSGSESRW